MDRKFIEEAYKRREKEINSLLEHDQGKKIIPVINLRKWRRPAEDLTTCEKCGRSFSFIACRVSQNNPKREICLVCLVKEEKFHSKK